MRVSFYSGLAMMALLATQAVLAVRLDITQAAAPVVAPTTPPAAAVNAAPTTPPAAAANAAPTTPPAAAANAAPTTPPAAAATAPTTPPAATVAAAPAATATPVTTPATTPVKKPEEKTEEQKAADEAVTKAASLDPSGLQKATDAIEKSTLDAKDKQIAELRKDLEVSELKTKQHEVEITAEKKSEEIEKSKIQGLEPDQWLVVHPEKSKIEALVKKEGQKEAEKIIEKQKEIKSKAKATVAKKTAEEEKKERDAAKIKDAIASVKNAPPKAPEPIVAEYGKPTQAVPVTVATDPNSTEGAQKAANGQK